DAVAARLPGRLWRDRAGGRADNDPVPGWMAAALRFRTLHLDPGRHLVRPQGLHGVLHVRHGEGFRAALSLRPTDAAWLEGFPADLALHGRGHGCLPQSHRTGGVMTAGLVGALIGLAVAAVDYALLTALGRRVDLDETRRVLRITGLSQFVLLPVIGYFVAPYVAGE